MSAGARVAGARFRGGAGRRGNSTGERVIRRVATAHVVAAAAGAIDVLLLLWLVLPRPDYAPAHEGTFLLVNAAAAAVVVPLALVAGTVWGYRVARPILRFATEEREPTEAERAATLRHPLRSAGIDATLWLLAAVIYTVLNLQFSADAALHVGSTVLMGGATTTAVSYLLTERVFRPLTARALASGPVPDTCLLGVRSRLVLAWVLTTGVPLLGLAFVSVHVLVDGDVPSDRIGLSVLILALGAAVVGLGATRLVSRSVADPLLALRSAIGRLEAGDLDVRVRVDDGSEVGLLQSGFNRMAAGLGERERLRDLFGRHVGEDVARSAVERPIALGGEQREVAALFIDLVGSTSLATRCPPEDVVALLNRFFAVVVDTVETHGGWVNKFEGDAALCVFGAPVEDAGCATGALAAARALAERLARELPEVDAGIGVSAGTAVAGNVGAERRFEYTVIGDPVNEAARLCELSKRRPERVLASEAVVRRAAEEEGECWRLGDAVVLRGRTEPTRLAMPAIGRVATPRPIAAP